MIFGFLSEMRKNPGVLTIKNGGNIELEVVGLFDDNIKSLYGDNDLDRIIGQVENDGKVSDIFLIAITLNYWVYFFNQFCTNIIRTVRLH